jgi:predicted dehydrogenase
MGISIGVIGAGQFSRSFIPLFQAHPDVSEVRLAELLPDRLATVAARHSIERTYASGSELIASDVDAVAIFTQRWTHGPLAIEALKAGKHVYSTVPMANSTDDIGGIIDAAVAAGRIYMMGETSHYYPAAVFCRQKAAAGEFGRIFYAEGDYVHDMDLGFYAAYQYSGGERWKETASFPPMLYPTHALGAVLSVMDTHATAVSCVGVHDQRGDGVFDASVSMWGNDFSNETALFSTANGGAIRTNEHRRIGYPSHIKESRYRIFGTERSFEELATVSLWQDKKGVEDVTERLRPGGGNLDAEELQGIDPALRDAFVSGCAAVHDRSRLPASYTGLPNGHLGSHQFLADDFVRACVSGQLPPVNAWVAARYTLPGIIAHESAKQGGVQLEIPDFGDAPA